MMSDGGGGSRKTPPKPNPSRTLGAAGVLAGIVGQSRTFSKAISYSATNALKTAVSRTKYGINKSSNTGNPLVVGSTYGLVKTTSNGRAVTSALALSVKKMCSSTTARSTKQTDSKGWSLSNAWNFAKTTYQNASNFLNNTTAGKIITGTVGLLGGAALSYATGGGIVGAAKTIGLALLSGTSTVLRGGSILDAYAQAGKTALVSGATQSILGKGIQVLSGGASKIAATFFGVTEKAAELISTKVVAGASMLFSGYNTVRQSINTVKNVYNVGITVYKMSKGEASLGDLGASLIDTGISAYMTSQSYKAFNVSKNTFTSIKVTSEDTYYKDNNGRWHRSNGQYASNKEIGIKKITDSNNTSNKGWHVGDPIDNLTAKGNKPTWSTVRSRYWKNEAYYNSELYTESNLELMRKGYAPRHSEIDVPMELHHKNGRNIPNANSDENLEKLWPWEHSDKDPYRHYSGPRPGGE